MSQNWTGETLISSIAGVGTSGNSQQAREVVSLRVSEETEKTLHHLAGKVQELRARLERVLVPTPPSGVAGELRQGASNVATSPLTDRLRSFRDLAQSSIDSIEDILNRLDV
jgi:hypothetical protein